MLQPEIGDITTTPDRLTESSSKQEVLTIAQKEKKLGIESPTDRLLEASLFIDSRFLSYAIITGVVEKPEHIFGEKAWEGYIDGRFFAKEYGNKDLTADFILDLHKKVTEKDNPEISGVIRPFGVQAASFDNPTKPVTYSREQVAAIEENPYLSFKPFDEADPDSNTGFIRYPHSGMSKEVTQKAIAQDLDEIAEWFNRIKKGGDHSPQQLAAELQHRIISLHPFLDCNGRVSRILMNWSLENDGETPSILESPNDDLFTRKDQWTTAVAEGSKRYQKMRKRYDNLKEVGIDSPAALFDLGQDTAFYNYIFTKLRQGLPLPTDGSLHNHSEYEAFLASFRSEMQSFQDFMRSTSTISTKGGDLEITQGGFITPEFIAFAKSVKAQPLSSEMRKQTFTDIEAYRGGMVEGDIDDQKILRMFQEYTAVGTGYEALSHSHQSPTTAETVEPASIEQGLEVFNRLIAAAYFVKRHPEIPNPYKIGDAPIRDLSRVITDHVRGGKEIWNSPFASTSLSYNISRDFAERWYADYAQKAHHGVLLRALVPREGVIMTHGDQKIDALGNGQIGIPSEEEILIAGGIQPASLQGVEIFDRDGVYGAQSRIATRVEFDGNTQIVIEDLQGEFIVVRTYQYDPETQKFAFVGTEETETPSELKRTQKIRQKMDIINVYDILIKDYSDPFQSKIDKNKIYSYFEKDMSNTPLSSKDKQYLMLNDFPENKIGYEPIIPTISSFPEINSEKKQVDSLLDIHKIYGTENYKKIPFISNLPDEKMK